MDNEVTIICWTKLGIYINSLGRMLEIGDVFIVRSGRRRSITLVWKRTVASTLKMTFMSDDFPDRRCVRNPRSILGGGRLKAAPRTFPTTRSRNL